MNDSALDILAGTFKKQETFTDTNTYTFESKITVLDKNIGAGCPVHVFEKATGVLIYTTETDSESFIYVPNLLKNIKYFVVATDKNDTYSSIIFDLNWDFAQQSGNKYNLKYYNKYQASSSKDIYTYMDTVSNLVYDPSLLYSISVPLQKEDQKATWFGTGVFNVENIEGFPSFSFKGSASAYTYINFTPVQTGDSFTVECYIRPLALFSGKTVAGGVFSQNTSQGLFISDDFRLSYKNKNLTINTISTLEADTWYHVAVSYDSKRIRLFLNGKKEAETEDSIGLEYLSTVFCIGAGFYGYLSGFKIFQESKYEEDFTPSFRPFGHLPVIYSNEEDPYANNTVLKSYISDSGYLRDKAKNIPLSFDYTIPKDSYIVSNNSFIRTPTQYADLALNGDFTIEVKFRLLYRTGTNPVIFGNKASKTEWATNNWHLHADHPNQLEKYGLSIYGGNYNNSLANYPAIYNEPVSLVLQRKGTTYSYYFNGFADRSFTYATAMDTRTFSYFSIGGDTSFELYDIKVTKGVARYSENYKDEQLQGSENLLKAYYQIVNYPFKESLYDARNALAFVNTGVLLTSDRSSYKTRSAFFANSYFVTSKSYWYTPNESFTVEFKISCSTLPLTTDDIINTATLFSIFTATSDNFKLAIRDKYLSFYNGIEWLDSEFELDVADTFKHIVLQRNSTSIKILAEGSLVLETTCPDLAGRRNVSIGANKAGSDTFNGYMNNLFIYKNYCKYEDNYQVPEDPDEYVPIDEEKEPEVIVTPFTTSALNFEKGLIDQIGTTIWNKEGTANVTSTNKIFGDNSFETKALGDSLYTNSNIITGGSIPFTIEFYALVKKYASVGNFFSGCAILSQNKGGGDSDQQLLIQNNRTYLYRGSNGGSNPFAITRGTTNINFNDINKYTLTYDGAALRLFINDKLDITVGTLTGWDSSHQTPFKFFDNIVSGYTQYRVGAEGIIDNINIHDGIATKVRDYDPYEEYLVVDLPFDGENNSTKIVDNGTLKSQWTVNGGAKISTDQKFDGFSSLYLDGYSGAGLISSTQPIANEDTATISFSVIQKRQDSNVYYDTYDGNYDGGFQLIHYNGFFGLWYSNQFESSGKTLINNVSYDITFTYENGLCKLYIDGILTINKILPINFKNMYCIGAQLIYNNPNYYSHAYIKNFKIYKGVAIIPENPTGKIQLDFDNNVIDKYGNSTWTNNGVIFDQVNSVKGHSASFNSTYVINSSINSMDFKNLNFSLEFDSMKKNMTASGVYMFSSNIAHDDASLEGVWLYKGSSTNNFSYIDYKNKPINITSNINNDYPNVWYNEVISRTGGVLLQSKNDVLILIHNITNQVFNFSKNGFILGKSQWSSANFVGYIDNFKSSKENLSKTNYKPAVHLPLETSAINTGLVQLTINSVGNPIHTIINGKKCIKFEQDKYLTISTNNIFNLGSSTDFYIEFDFNPINTDAYHVLLSNGTTNSTTGTLMAMSLGNSTTVDTVTSAPKPYCVYIYHLNRGLIFTNNSYRLDQWNNVKLIREGNKLSIILNGIETSVVDNNMNMDFSLYNTHIGRQTYGDTAHFKGYMSNFKMFVGTSQPPETYNDKKVLDLDFKPTGKSYLFKDNNNKCIIHPVNITQRDYQDSEYCCYFNGTNQYLQLGKNDLFNIGNDDFVLSVKFKFQKRGQNLPLLTGGVTTNTAGYWYVQVRSENSATNPLKIEFVYRIDDSNVYTIYCNQTLIENEIYEFTVVREGSTMIAYLNDVPNFTITDNRLPPSFNLNGNGNTYIGVNQYNPSDWIYKGYIYHVKFARNTSDKDILKPPKKQTGVEVEKTDGIWIQSVSVVGSSASWIKYDPQGAQTEEWQTFFANTLDFGVLQYKNQSSPTTTLTQTGSAIIDKSPLNKVFKIIAGNGTWYDTSIGCNLEFLDKNDNVVAALKWYQDGTFRHAISYGPNLGSQTRVGVGGSYPQTNGELSITPSGFIYTNKATTNYNESFSYNTDLSGVTKIRVSGLSSTYDYSGAGAAYYVFQQLPTE